MPPRDDTSPPPAAPALKLRRPVAVDADPARDAAIRSTPAMRQYFGFKKQRPDCVLFFRMGDFYELFDADAVLAHKVLGITLTERTAGLPMAGVPFHSAEAYFRRMLEAGHRVAVVDQVQDPKEAKGVVDRALSRVLTPGTLVDETLLADDSPAALAAVYVPERNDLPCAAAVLDLSTGAFTLLESEFSALAGELQRRGVTEVLYADASVDRRDGEAPAHLKPLLEAIGASGTARPSWQFRPDEASEAVREQFRVATLAGFGLADDDACVRAAGAALRYLHETQPAAAVDGSLAHIAPPRKESLSKYLALDPAALRALEIERTIRAGRADSSLISVFSGPGACRTAMGKRLLREWLVRPLAERGPIEARLACVSTLVEDRRTAQALCEALRSVQDVARIAGRLGMRRATPRDIVALGRSLAQLDALASAIDNAPAFADHRARLSACREALAPLAQEIAAACVDAPPNHLREGGLFRDGVDADLDECRLIQRDGAAWLAAYQTRLVQEHELPGIKVGFNKVFGYYIELTAAQARKAPDVFSRKQTLKNAERYTTPELKEYEHKATTAEARAIERENKLFEALCARAAEKTTDAAAFAQCAAELDVLACFAERAHRRRWTRPEIVDEPTLNVIQARHPVLEDLLADQFVPNDVCLATPERPAPLALITGPNMAGKSTYIRTAALVALLAHCGSFVPAESATVGLVDRIFTRVGAEDALAAGQSTFMVEMTETASILHHATARSLVILDEIGRGTSTLDGLSLAWAIAERLGEGTEARRHEGTEGKAGSPRTLFATHYHELTALEESMPGRVANLHVAVREWGDQIVFLHRILPGRTDRSYGIHVAQLAGMPREVVKRARELLERLSVEHAPVDGGEPASRKRGRAMASSRDEQMALFTEYVPHPAVEELKKVDLEGLTPMGAFDVLRGLVERVRDPSG